MVYYVYFVEKNSGKILMDTVYENNMFYIPRENERVRFDVGDVKFRYFVLYNETVYKDDDSIKIFVYLEKLTKE